MITEVEARRIILQLGTAIFNDDKESREMIYSDLDTDSLKRIIRWAMREYLFNFSALCLLQGAQPQESWSKMAAQMNLHLDEAEEMLEED